MKAFIRECCSNRFGYDGWALKVRGAEKPMEWSTCTTREEARDLRREWFSQGDMFPHIDIVKVKITVGVCGE